MQEILFQVGLFSELSQPGSERVMRALLESLVIADVEYLRENPGTPRLYQSGVLYQREPLITELAARFPQCASPCRPEIHPETWKGIGQCLRDRQADCEDLASWCTAERIVRDNIAAHIDFAFRWVTTPTGDRVRVYHIFVRMPDGSIEDPSARLGMVKP